MGNKRLKGLAGLVFAAAMPATGGAAAAAPADLPQNADLSQFYPGQADLPNGWSATGLSMNLTARPEATTPPGCFFASLFPDSGDRRVEGPDGSHLFVQVLRAPAGLRTVRAWAAKCASHTALGGGGTTGKNWMSVQPAEAPDAGALAYRVTGQGPFVAPELEIAGAVRGVLVLVSQFHPADDDAAAEVYRATAAKINEWRG